MVKHDLEETHQVAQLATLLAVATDSGLSLVGALHETFGSAKGSVAVKFQRLLAALDLGGNLFDELATLRSTSGGRAMNDLVIKLQVSLQFGSPLTEQLMQFSTSLRSELAQQQLTASTKKENLMLLPLVFLILPVTVLFAIFPAIQYLNIPY
jgi:tight adherence protein C